MGEQRLRASVRNMVEAPLPVPTRESTDLLNVLSAATDGEGIKQPHRIESNPNSKHRSAMIIEDIPYKELVAGEERPKDDQASIFTEVFTQHDGPTRAQLELETVTASGKIFNNNIRFSPASGEFVEYANVKDGFFGKSETTKNGTMSPRRTKAAARLLKYRFGIEKPAEKIDHPKGYERQYTGVCDVVNPEDVRAMLAEIRESRADPVRRLMVGVMTHPAVLNPDLTIPENIRKAIQSEFPTVEEISQGFIDDPDVMNTIHYADLYGPNGPWKPGEAPDVLQNLELCVKHGGPNLDAIQLDLVWPDPEALLEFRKRHPNIEIVLQIGKFSFEEDGTIDDTKVVERLHGYGKSVDHVLLDLSMGKGRQMTDEDVASLKKLMWAIQDASPDIGLAIAGGLGAGSSLNSPNQSVYSMDSLREIARDFPGVSIDAQGGLKPDDAVKDSRGHFIASAMADTEKSQNYIGLASEILDGEMELGNYPDR